MQRLKIPVLILALAVAVAFAGYRMLASEETRIRWLLEDAATSFNETSLSGCLEGFAKDYRDAGSAHVDRKNLRTALQYVFFTHVDGRTKAFLLRVLILGDESGASEEPIAVEVTEGAETATARCVLDLQRKRGETWLSQWRLRLTAQLRKVDGDWRIVSSSHETLDGERPR